MPWNIGLDDNDFKILNATNSTTYDNTHYKNYFTIRDDGNVGINNGNPEVKLVVEGDTKINGSVNTSNIIGIPMNTSNILRINYEENYNNNKLEIYGNTIFNGDITISNALISREIQGVGSNITHINVNNVNTGVLKGVNGGTGIDGIRQGEILYGDVNNNARQSHDFYYNPINNTLHSLEFSGRGTNIRELNANNITTGRLPVNRGGTNLSKYEVSGGILIGNINNEFEIAQINKLTWNNQNNNLVIDGNIRLAANSNIFIDSEKLTYKHIGIYPTATSNVAGIIKWDEKIFEINTDEQLSLKNINRNSKWGQASSGGSTEESDIIFFPTALPFDNKCVGIGTVPEISPFYRLHVDGDINLTNGRYKINGYDIDEMNSNFLSSKIDTLSLDNINANYGGSSKRCFQLLPTTTADGTIFEYKIEGDNNESFKFKSLVTFEQGIQIDSDLAYTGNLKVSSVEITSGIAGIAGLPAFKVNQLNGDADSTIAHFLHQNRIQMLLDGEGRLGIGPNFDSDKLPKEKLDVEGNIIVSGHITSYYSDERLKHFTSNIRNSLEIINKLNGYYYEPNEKALEYGFKFEKQIGLSAQEVQKVLPEITKLAPFDTMKDGDGNCNSKSGENYLTICYERLGPVFVEAIKELTQEIKNLKIENIEILKELDTMKMCRV
jgi:hypothetical protein